MTNHFLHTDPSEWEVLSGELSPSSVELSADQVNQAVQMSEFIQDYQQRWQTYLNALALTGFKQWIGEWASELTVNDSECSLYSAKALELNDFVYNVQVGEFSVCLISAGTILDETIPIPDAVNSASSHFYVLVEVLEEEMQTNVYGYFRHDQLMQRRKTLKSEHGIYMLPLDYFNSDSNDLLLDLRHLEPSAVFPTTDAVTSSGQKPGSVLQRTINTALWLSARLDQVAQSLSWVLMPPLVTEMRSSVRSDIDEDFRKILPGLERKGVTIPSEARGACHDLDYQDTKLRLYAFVWGLLQTEAQPEWILLVFLKSQMDKPMPINTRLQIQDATQVLAEAVSTPETQDSSLCIQVAGRWDENFTVTISFMNGAGITLPAFIFNPGNS
jgi:Protein of unknown function (DUF1822)